ncbi:MAG: hypothetical protein LBQ51_05110 [Desulfovibrio sp.]|jgi:uncharacterized coiled-coil protein SlyX|nr:hypothetical protein [Desulfovibrio sp.]
MIEPFIQEIMNSLKSSKRLPSLDEKVSVLESHLAFLSDNLTVKEKELAKAEIKLESMTAELECLRTCLAALDGKAVCIDIGPCFIKQDKSGKRLEGIYCSHCHSLMKKGQYADYGEEFVYICCQCSYRLPVESVDRAISDFFTLSRNA